MKIKYKLLPVLLGVTIAFSGCGLSQANRSYSKALDFYKDGKYQEAEEYFVKAIDANKDKAEYRLDYGFDLIQLGRFKDARDQFTGMILEKDIAMVLANNKQAYRGIGISYLLENNYEEAIKNFDLALAIKQKSDLDTDILHYKGNALEQDGKLQEAADIYAKILEKDDKDAAIYVSRANIERMLGNYEQCIADYDKAISLTESNFDMYFGKFAALKELGKETEANEVLEKASSIKIKTDYDKFQLAKVHYYQGKYDEAVIELTSCTESGFTESYYFLGEISLSKKDYTSAISQFTAYIDGGNRLSALLYNQLLTCYLETNQLDQAKDCLAKAKKYSDASIKDQLLKNEIIYLESTGQFSEALSKMKVYMENYPQDTAAQKDYYFLITRVGENDTQEKPENTEDKANQQNDNTSVAKP